MLKRLQCRNGTGFAASLIPRVLQVKELDPALLVECCSLVKVSFARAQTAAAAVPSVLGYAYDIILYLRRVPSVAICLRLVFARLVLLLL